jgi:signal transduction histidine kinase
MFGIEELPGSVRIAVTLLDVLAESGDFGARARALREAGVDAQILRSSSGWIAQPALRAMFGAASADRKLACRVGRRLLSSDGIGFFLCYSGVATVEKAYRRCDQLLARESRSSRYEALEIERDRARVAFHAVAEEGDERAPDPLFCGLRQGMLEAVPTLFGLLPARVREVECTDRGADRCVYEVRWSRDLRSGLYAGAALGVALGIGFAVGLTAMAGVSAAWLGLPGVVILGLLGAGAGRSLDLTRQLEAVAGARRGQLALLDQADRSLAEKMDQLAKLGAEVEPEAPASSEGLVRARSSRRAAEEEGQPLGVEVATKASRQLHDILGRLQSGLGGLHARLVEGQDYTQSQLVELLEECVEASRQIQGVGAELAQEAQQGGREREVADLAAIVRRAADAVRPSQPDSLELALEIEVEPAPVRCDPYQIEQVAIQLMLNAAEAMQGSGPVRVGLRSAPTGLELTVEDAGPGIEPELLERLFDPFDVAPVAGVDTGFGLTVSYRIVQEHGGELRVESEPDQGTRVTVTLPRDLLTLPPGDSPQPD